MTIVNRLAGCSLVSTQPMRSAVVYLIVLYNGAAILVVVTVAIIVVAVVVAMISVTVTLIAAVAIVVVVVLIPTPILLIVSTVIGGTSTNIYVHILHSLHHGLHLLEHLLLGSIVSIHGVGHLGV